MKTTYSSPVQYEWMLGEDCIIPNELIGKNVFLEFNGYQCLSCGSNAKIYRMGHCYKCFYQSPHTADWIIRPELSTAHLGVEDRDLGFEQEAQLAPHVVYLAISSNIKVGVTRKSQVPTRWIDQGATSAMVFLETPNRYLAGIAEVKLKNFVADKTNWRKMLQNDLSDDDLLTVRDELIDVLPEEVKEYVVNQPEIWDLQYPVVQYPVKVKSLNLVKNGSFQGVLMGVKGQYLIFEDQTVFNIRGNEGLVINLRVAERQQLNLF